MKCLIPSWWKKGFNWDVTSPWHNFLEGVQGAVGPEEARAETAKPAQSSSLAKWEKGLDAGFSGCLADLGWSVKNLNQNISVLTALRSQPWTRSLTYITVVFLHLVLLCLVCYMGDFLSMCENGYSMQSCCCDRILENEIHGCYSVGLVKFWDTCKNASAMFSTCICLLKCVLKIFCVPQDCSLTVASVSFKR